MAGLLGQGAFGQVRVVVERDSGVAYALKIVDKKRVRVEDKDRDR